MPPDVLLQGADQAHRQTVPLSDDIERPGS